ncbi:Imm10 family immunity protein [Algibacter sp. TI.3.09]|uniref:Imm10 family immunity protein n=1 Tax=Algibacter sp. TI.3.09 TaxID=3121298 RepID=UPI00311EE570
MKIELNIKTINISNNIEEGYKMIAFGDNEEESNIENYLIVQRANMFDEQDKQLEMDSYYLEYNDQSNSGYGICKEVILDSNKISFNFPSNKDSEIENITLKLESKDYDKDKLKQYLKEILGEVLNIKL